jgi:hypothetical protein
MGIATCFLNFVETNIAFNNGLLVAHVFVIGMASLLSMALCDGLSTTNTEIQSTKQIIRTSSVWFQQNWQRKPIGSNHQGRYKMQQN